MKKRISRRLEICSQCDKKVTWVVVQEVVNKSEKELETVKIPYCRSCGILDVPVKVLNASVLN